MLFYVIFFLVLYLNIITSFLSEIINPGLLPSQI